MAKKKKHNNPQPSTTLRERAERMLRTSPTELAGMPTEDLKALVHELQVHQVELEIQNEELRQAQVELAESRDRYSDLYEFAPVGYLTLDRDGRILQANLGAADMLGVDRQKLVGAKFAVFVDRDGQDSWHLHRKAVLSATEKQMCELPLRVPPDKSLWVRLESTAFSGDSDSASHCRAALIDVTQRKQAEQALRVSEEHFRTMADGVPLIIWVHNPRGEQEFVNQTFCEFFGITQEEARDDRWQAMVHPDDVDEYAQEFRASVRDRRSFHAAVRVRRSDGQWRWIESWGNPRFSPSDEYLGLVGTSLDITDRKWAEEQLHDMNASLEQQVSQRTATLNLLQDLTRAANEARSVEAAMREALSRILQFNGWQIGHVWQLADDGSGEMISSGIWQVHENTALAIRQLDEFRRVSRQTRLSAGQGMIGQVLASGEPKWVDDVEQYDDWQRGSAMKLGLRAAIAFPVMVKRDVDEVAPILAELSAATKVLPTSATEVVAVLEFFADHPASQHTRFMEIMPDVGIQLGHAIARQQAEKLLRASEVRHRAVLDAAADAIISTDRYGVITSVNPATERIFGYTADELVGKNVRLLMPMPYREEHVSYIARYLETRQPHIIGVGREAAAQRKDGRIFPIRININEIDHLSLFVGIVQDISRQKALEKQVVDAAADEQRRIGHDIHDGVGQELTGLRYMAQTHAETLARKSIADAKTAERMTQWLETVQQQLRAIIRELVPVEIDQQGLVAALRGLAERTTEAHDVVCSFECQQPITVSDAALATHLYRIAQEAVRNGVRHAQAQAINVRLSEQEGRFTLQISDDGIGISETPEMSTGIGLRSMAYRAGLIGATFDVRRTDKGGTWVTCTILREGVASVNGECPHTNDEE